jgi:hypothetical protein
VPDLAPHSAASTGAAAGARTVTITSAAELGATGNFFAANDTVVIAPGEPTPTPAAQQLLNISTRLNVQTGDNVLIGGIIITGTEPKKVIMRAIRPSLGAQGVSGALADPALELIDANGSTVRANDNWKGSQQFEIEALGIQPAHDAESALIATLPSGNYTAVVHGSGDTTGVGLVEVYTCPDRRRLAAPAASQKKGDRLVQRFSPVIGKGSLRD